MSDLINVQEVMREIRERVRQYPAPRLSKQSSVPDLQVPEAPDWVRLEEAGKALRDAGLLVGQMPPEPPTIRGKVGAFFVNIVRRVLFWYTAQLFEFHEVAAQSFDEQSAALGTLSRQVAELRAETERLQLLLGVRRKEVEKIVKTHLLPETRARQLMQVHLEEATHKLEETTVRLDREIAAREMLDSQLVLEANKQMSLETRLNAVAAAGRVLRDEIKTEREAREGLAQTQRVETVAREDLAHALTQDTQARERLEESIREADLAARHLRAEISSQTARISILLEQARKKPLAIPDEEQSAKLADEDKHALDALYLALEDRFRGTRKDIMESLRFYVPFLTDQKIGAGKMPILDLGCGRGEWLEVLAESGLEARGVDTNRVFLASCQERGLAVEEADALQYLRTLRDGSLGAVTGFHFIEHLSLDTLIKLFDETVRVLKPGGLAVFETPNPQNVLVGCRDFHADLTRIKPLPAVTVQFILEARGLCDVRILPLHPYPDSYKIQAGETELAQRFNDYFYGPQDYAVIGRRV